MVSLILFIFYILIVYQIVKCCRNTRDISTQEVQETSESLDILLTLDKNKPENFKELIKEYCIGMKAYYVDADILHVFIEKEEKLRRLREKYSWIKNSEFTEYNIVDEDKLL